jgi:hypothetical protein
MLLISNFSTTRFVGFVPCTVPARFAAGFADVMANTNDPKTGRALTPTRICYGEVVGAARMAWVPVDLPAGESIAVDPNGTADIVHRDRELPESTLRDPVGQFGVTINGLPLPMVPAWRNGPIVTQDGPALRGHWRGRVSLLVVADVFVAWVPGEPWARFEVVYTAANPGIPLTSEHFPNGFELRIGNAIVGYLGQRFGPMLKDERMAQGQSRAFAGACFWQHLSTADQVEMASGLLHGSPVGIDQRWETEIGGMGVAKKGSTFNLRAWINQNYTNSIQALYRWQGPGIGVAEASGVTGAQEEQCFSAKGAECFGMQPIASLAVVARYATALGYAKRPCHWREADGSLLDFDGHNNPRLVFWDGVPHWHPAVSQDRLGMPSLPDMQERHGWSGPDREHWFYGSLFFAAMITGSRALQLDLESQARVVWFQETVIPGWSTSNAGASRGVGWFGIMVTGLDRCLKNRDTAQRVRQRALERLRMVYVPQLTRPGENPAVWDARPDPRLLQELDHHFENITLADGSTLATSQTLPPGATSWQVVYHWEKAWMPYQQAVGAFGLWQMSVALGAEDGKALALAAAKAVVECAYDPHPTKVWHENGILAYPSDGRKLNEGEGRPVVNPGFFRHAWMPLAAWVVLQHEPTNERALSIWSRLTSEVEGNAGTHDWMPPLDRAVAPAP